MKRSTGLALAAPALGLLLFAGACSSSSESSSDTSQESTTTESTVDSTTTTVEEVTTTEAPATSTTASSGDACADVTEAEVESALSNVTVEEWHCATDSEGRPWVGGYGSSDPGGVNENFILETGGDQAFVQAPESTMAECSNPPIPSSLLTWCEAG